jgi:hypothetical protein
MNYIEIYAIIFIGNIILLVIDWKLKNDLAYII